jgi:hypothetical protein
MRFVKECGVLRRLDVRGRGRKTSWIDGTKDSTQICLDKEISLNYQTEYLYMDEEHGAEVHDVVSDYVSFVKYFLTIVSLRRSSIKSSNSRHIKSSESDSSQHYRGSRNARLLWWESS